MQTRPYTTCPKSMKEFCSIRSASCAPVLLTRYIFTRLSRDGSIRREKFSKAQNCKIHPSRNSRSPKTAKFTLREILEAQIAKSTLRNFSIHCTSATTAITLKSLFTADTMSAARTPTHGRGDVRDRLRTLKEALNNSKISWGCGRLARTKLMRLKYYCPKSSE